MDILSLPFIFPKVSSPASSENEMSLNLSHPYQKSSFPGLSDYGISNKFHSPVYRTTEYHIKFHSPVYRITEYQTRSFPGLSDYGISNKVSFPGLSDYGISNKCLSPVCRITEGHSNSIFLTVSSPSMSDNEASLNFNYLKKIVIYGCHAQCVWSRGVTKKFCLR